MSRVKESTQDKESKPRRAGDVALLAKSRTCRLGDGRGRLRVGVDLLDQGLVAGHVPAITKGIIIVHNEFLVMHIFISVTHTS